MKTIKYYLAGLAMVSFITASTVIGALGGCGGGSSGGGSGGDGDTAIVDENGNEISSVDTNDPVNLTLGGLDANTQYHISVTDPAGTLLSPAGGYIATTDEDGNLPNSTIIQDLSTTPANATLILNSQGIVPRIKAATGAGATIEVADANGDAVIDPITFTVADNSKVFCSDSSGTARASFTPSESVYATVQKASGSLADGTYTCYVFSDLSTILEDESSLAGTQVSVTVTGGTGTANLGTYALGAYDVVCDLDGNQTYDRGSDLISRASRFRPCFTIQGTNTGNDIIGQICSDRNGNYRDVFDPDAEDSSIRDVWAWIAPQERSLVEHSIGVRKYVVAHQTTWTDGDALTDVTGADGGASFELDAVQGFCTNESPWLVWPRQRLRAGCYDCIIDVDHNGIYDKGTDFVDNIDNSGDDSVGGMCVSSTACNIISITSHDDGDSVDATAITLVGSVSEAVSSGKVTITSGTQSNTASLTIDAGNAFSAIIPLFNGQNLVTLSVTKSNGIVCSKTLKLTSTSTSSDGQLLRAQLTWDGSTDMDLHLVKPGGSYSNGGHGDGSDCNFGNCKVGLDGSLTNSITWGAKLDVDCVSCGNGIENIWMNEITTDGAYGVYVDAYSGSETAVTVTIFIKGATVGTVSCGAMAEDTGTDSCFVGTITWSGGSSGNGNFTASGTLASDY